MDIRRSTVSSRNTFEHGALGGKYRTESISRKCFGVSNVEEQDSQRACLDGSLTLSAHLDARILGLPNVAWCRVDT